MVKKKKRKSKRGKKISLPNNVAPIIVVPHENRIVEDNDTSYDLENLFGTCLEEYDNCYTIGAIHTINDESDYAYDMKRPKLGDATFNEDDILVSQVLICKFIMMIACLLLMMIIVMILML